MQCYFSLYRLLFVHITRYAFFFVLLLVFYCSFSSSSSSPWCFRIAPHCFSHSKCLSIVWCFTKAGKSSRYFYCFKCFRQYWNGRIYQLKNLALSLLISFEIAWKRTEHKHIGSSHTKQRHEQRAKRAKASRKKKEEEEEEEDKQTSVLLAFNSMFLLYRMKFHRLRYDSKMIFSSIFFKSTDFHQNQRDRQWVKK